MSNFNKIELIRKIPFKMISNKIVLKGLFESQKAEMPKMLTFLLKSCNIDATTIFLSRKKENVK